MSKQTGRYFSPDQKDFKHRSRLLETLNLSADPLNSVKIQMFKLFARSFKAAVINSRGKYCTSCTQLKSRLSTAVSTAPAMNNSVICNPAAQRIIENFSFSENAGSVIQKPLFPLELNGKVGNAK